MSWEEVIRKYEPLGYTPKMTQEESISYGKAKDMENITSILEYLMDGFQTEIFDNNVKGVEIPEEIRQGLASAVNRYKGALKEKLDAEMNRWEWAK